MGCRLLPYSDPEVGQTGQYKANARLFSNLHLAS
jgi:hypothetical protein